MSVPLDRLYYFLQTCVNDDVVIYHWYPHGSKKLQDLVHLGPIDLVRAWNLPQIIFHDQEPFDPDFWTEADLQQAIGNVWRDTWGYPDVPDFFAWMTHRRLNALVSTNIYAKTVLVHSNYGFGVEDQNHEHCYYWCHALLARDWFRYAQHEFSRPKSPARNRTTFLCYNRAWTGTREYRIKFADLLVENQLHDHCLTWFNAYENTVHYTQHCYQNPHFRPNSLHLDSYFDKSDSPALASADYVSEHYASTNWEVVLETVFDDETNFLTEKILRPIACRHPFVVAAAPGTLELLRQYGFRTFGDYIDESYDTMQDPLSRLHSIMSCMHSILALSDQDYDQVCRIAQFNHERFFSDEFSQFVIDEYQSNMTRALDAVKHTRGSGRLQYPKKWQSHWDNMVARYPILQRLTRHMISQPQWI